MVQARRTEPGVVRGGTSWRAACAVLLLACSRGGDPVAVTPSLAIVRPGADPSATHGVLQVQVVVEGAQPATVKLTVDGTPLANVPPPFAYAWDTRALPEATYALGAEMVIEGQTYASTPRTIVVDRTPPLAPSVDPRVCAAGADASALTGAAEANATITLYEGSSALATAAASAAGRWSATLPLAAGDHAVTATATDAAGNVSRSTSFSLVVDGSAGQVPPPPTVTQPPPALTNYPSLWIEGVAVAGNTVDLLWDGVTARSFEVAQPDGSWGVFLDVAQGTHVFSATQTTPGGCTSQPTSPVTVVDDRTAPGAPVLTGSVPSVVNRTGPASFTVSGTADAQTTVTVFGLSAVLGSAQVSATGGAWSVAVTSSSLPEGAYPLTALAQDAAGNSSPQVSTATVLVDRTPPAPPRFTQVPAVLNALSTTFTVSGTAEARSSVSVYRGAALLASAQASASDGAWSVSGSASTLPEGSWSLVATATDAAGNPSDPATSATLLVDRTPPAAPGLSAPATAKPGVAFTVAGAAGADVQTVRVYEVVGRGATCSSR